MTGHPRLCRAEPEDLKNILSMYRFVTEDMEKQGIAIWDAYYPFALFPGDIDARRLYLLKSGDALLSAFALEAENAGEKAVEWRLQGKACYIDRFAVSAAQRHRGIGIRSLELAEEEARKRGAQVLRLFVAKVNTPAIALYEKCGFTRTAGEYRQRIDENTVLPQYGYEKAITDKEEKTMMHEPLTIRELSIKNRIAIPPMVCFHWAGDNGLVTDKNLTHYRELAEGGAGLIIIEATAVSKHGRLHNTELGLWEDSQIEGFRQIADVIHTNGAKSFVQLVYAGGNGFDREANAPSTLPYRGGHNQGKEMPPETIEQVCGEFAAAALRAKKAGFDGVELHGCHGYLISCFFNSRTNLRTDAYGQDKALFAKQVIRSVREACGADFIVGIRLGAFEPTLEDGLRHAKELNGVADFLNVSYGGDCDPFAPEGFPCSAAVYGAMKVKELLPDMPVFGVDGINSKEDVENALKTGIDMAVVGRASLVDPAFANHVLNDEESGHCLHCSRYCRWNPPTMADPNAICPGYRKYHKE